MGDFGAKLGWYQLATNLLLTCYQSCVGAIFGSFNKFVKLGLGKECGFSLFWDGFCIGVGAAVRYFCLIVGKCVFLQMIYC